MELLSITSHVKLHHINCQELLRILVNPNLNLYIAAAMKCRMKIFQIQAFVPLYPTCGIDFGSFILHPASSIQDYYIYNYRLQYQNASLHLAVPIAPNRRT